MTAASAIGARACWSGKHPKRGCHQSRKIIVPQDFFAHVFTVTVPHERCD
jgi:hypothetical protein